MSLVQTEIKTGHVMRDVARRLGQFTSTEYFEFVKKEYPGMKKQVSNGWTTWTRRRMQDGSLKLLGVEGRSRRFEWVTNGTPLSKVEVRETMETITAPKPPEVSLTDKAVQGLIEATVDLVGVLLLEGLKKVKGEIVAEFEAKLANVKLERLEELTKGLGQHKKLYDLIQEAKAPAKKAVRSPQVAGVNGTKVEYAPPFLSAFNAIEEAEVEHVDKAIRLLVNNGPQYQSLQTKRLLQSLPDVPKDAESVWMSRAGNFRFAWGRDGQTIVIFNLFRRGESGYIDRER